MLVKNWMSKEVVTVDVDCSIKVALELKQRHKVSALPVTREGKVVGVVTDTDFLRHYHSENPLPELSVHEIMSGDPITVPPDYTIEETSLLFLEKDIHGAPVIDDEGEMVGIITMPDLLRTMISLTGVARGGILFAFRVEDRPGSIRELTDVIRHHGGRLLSILSSYEKAPAGYRNVYIRAFGLERVEILQLIKALKEQAEMLYTVDDREDARQICIDQFEKHYVFRRKRM